MFREQRPQGGRFFAVEHAAARRSLPAFAQRDNDAVQGLDVLLSRLHAREDVAQIDEHGRALLERAEIFDLIELAFEIGEECLHLFLAGSRRFFRHGEGKRAPAGELEPFISDDRDGLGEIERGEGRIDRKSDDPVRERHLLILEAVALAPEQHRDVLATGETGREQSGCRIGGDHRLGLVVGARRGRDDERAVGYRRIERFVELRVFQDAIGAGGGAPSLHVGPAVARLDQAQPAEAKISHHARGCTNIFAQLRLDQHDDRARHLYPVLGLVGSGAGH